MSIEAATPVVDLNEFKYHTKGVRSLSQYSRGLIPEDAHPSDLVITSSCLPNRFSVIIMDGNVCLTRQYDERLHQDILIDKTGISARRQPAINLHVHPVTNEPIFTQSRGLFQHLQELSQPITIYGENLTSDVVLTLESEQIRSFQFGDHGPTLSLFFIMPRRLLYFAAQGLTSVSTLAPRRPGAHFYFRVIQ